jgi:hypothetical protein
MLRAFGDSQIGYLDLGRSGEEPVPKRILPFVGKQCPMINRLLVRLELNTRLFAISLCRRDERAPGRDYVARAGLSQVTFTSVRPAREQRHRR